MKVVKRDGSTEKVAFDKITARIELLCSDLNPSLDPTSVAKETISNIVDGISTSDLDMIAANVAESYKTMHSDYTRLAGRILMSNLIKSTPNSFADCMQDIYRNSVSSGEQTPVIEDLCGEFGVSLSKRKQRTVIGLKYVQFATMYKSAIDNIINSTPLEVEYIGMKTLMHNYLMKINDVIHDRPQYMFMRVAIALYIDSDSDIEEVLRNIRKCYKALGGLYIMHATPTLYNSCSPRQQMLSCFLLGVDDNIKNIMKTCANASLISKWAGGIGIHMHQIRSLGQKIYGTGGNSNGLVPQLRIWNDIALAWNQGGRRKGAIAIYLEPSHGDILEFLELKLPNGAAESQKARDLFYGMWIPDLFVKRLIDGKPWSLFSNDEAKILSKLYDGMYINGVRRDAYTEAYERLEAAGRAIATVPVNAIVDKIFIAQRESGTPYICFKDHVNRKSNHSNVGVINSSNLCTEIMEYSSSDSYACCTLSSINIPKYYNKSRGYNFKKLYKMTRLCVRNLNRIIEVNVYPVPECEVNNTSLRPIAIGIQGLADLFCLMRIPFDSKMAEQMDLKILETMYHAAITESVELAKLYGPYEKFAGSPMSQGKFQFDLWFENTQVERLCDNLSDIMSGDYDWDSLKEQVKIHGVRNSLFIALMPTVSTSQITGNNESFEPFTSNIYVKNTLGGRLTMVNKHMIEHLNELGLWNEHLKNEILNSDGSIQGIDRIPSEVKEIYKTVWEISQREIIRRAALRGAFVDQAQSLNIFARDNSDKILRSIMIYAWKCGLKTGSYYIHTKPAVNAQKTVTLAIKQAAVVAPPPIAEDACPIGCTSCSS